MLTVEICLNRLEDIIEFPPTSGHIVHEITNTWDQRFIRDVAKHVTNGFAISTSQSAIVLKLIDRYKDHLIAAGVQSSALDQLLVCPQYSKAPYQSVELPREVRWAGDNKLVFRCKYNQGVVEDIKRLKGGNTFLPHQFPIFNREQKLWIVDVNVGNYDRVMDVIKRHRFAFDDAVTEFFFEIENGKDQPSVIEATEQNIVVTVRNDEFFNAWLNTLKALEQ